MIQPADASHSVLIEVANVLGAFRDHLVIVGGWVPELLFPGKGHLRSVDVDIAVSPKAIASNVYETILQRMIDAGYSHATSPTRFTKNHSQFLSAVKVDLICGQYQTGQKTDSITVNGLPLSCLRGIDLAFEANDTISITGNMPDGAVNQVSIRIVRPVSPCWNTKMARSATLLRRSA